MSFHDPWKNFNNEELYVNIEAEQHQKWSYPSISCVGEKLARLN